MDNLNGTANPLIAWLLEGDPSIQYQTYRDLLGTERPDLQARIALEGWGAQFLSLQKPEGHWGDRFYQPKWISTHYTLLDLKNLAISREVASIRKSIAQVLANQKGEDGGILLSPAAKLSDLCVNAMFLNYASYFGAPEGDLRSIVDQILRERLPDGGFNCNANRMKVFHGSTHTTISVLEGILEYQESGYTYRLQPLLEAAEGAREFLLQHHLFLSDRTGEVIDKKYLMLSYPSRWKYDILRALCHFQAAGAPYDPRLEDALDVLTKKRRSDGTWPVQARHPGKTHFEMEKTGSPSRWNTLRALKVLNAYRPE
ncbi:MAG: hypothetical protein ACK2TZ_00090 [Anaerolineales bacterium]